MVVTSTCTSKRPTCSIIHLHASRQSSTRRTTVGGVHLSDLGMRKQAAYWATAIPKFMSQNRRTLELQSPGAALAGDQKRMITATPLTAEQTREEHARSEAQSLACRRKQDRMVGARWGCAI